MQELQAGAPVEHVLREVGLMASLVGAGVSPTQAIRAVERAESRLIDMGVWERYETQYHPGYGQPGYVAPTGYGKGRGYGPTGGYAVPTGTWAPMGTTWGGQQVPMTYMPTQWMGK